MDARTLCADIAADPNNAIAIQVQSDLNTEVGKNLDRCQDVSDCEGGPPTTSAQGGANKVVPRNSRTVSMDLIGCGEGGRCALYLGHGTLAHAEFCGQALVN